MHKIITCIPLYKETPDNDEKASLLQCFSVLKNREFCIFAPESLNLDFYKKLAKDKKVNLSVQTFEDKYFKSIADYSRLILNAEFYEKFKEYDYMFLYQLDGWIFRDELDYWCEQGYDYIGAPWFENYSLGDENSSFISPSGNGGVCLRKISSFINILKHKYNNKRFTRYKDVILNYIKRKSKIKSLFNFFRLTLFYFSDKNSYRKVLKDYNEDYVIVNYFPCIDENFKIAPNDINFKFSFEVNPRLLYKMNGYKLPFACHAFKRYDWEFWSDFIKL